MTEPTPPLPASQAEAIPSVAQRFAIWQRAGGIATPIATAVFAFLVAGLVVLATGHNPLQTYRAIFDGAGLNWLFPWVHGLARQTAAFNLQETGLLFIPLVLSGLAVAFAFRCGLFNIGGQGQYIVGIVTGTQMGVWFASMPGPAHIFLAVTAATLAGAVWGGIAGFLRATVGAHEVISTIMLNWIAIWVGSYLIGFGGPFQDHSQPGVPVSRQIAANAHLPVFWGSPLLQGLDIGFFVALGMLVLYWVVLRRTTLGFEVRAVGYNPDAARNAGIGVARNYFVAMAISGGFAGLAGALDILGWQFRLDVTTIQIASQLAFTGIAVALLGRNTAVGTFFAAVLFAGLLNGTSSRNLDPSVFPPELGGNLTRIIQGLVVLFVGADLLILYVWNVRRKLRRATPAAAPVAE
ncbi:MAG TPA: ABC transporter permease [Thermoleophilaceae bacterium]|nr:ABC transporter permease [Thermoleophilaceae bacterium]